jgi:hypothetical protein
MQTWDTAIGEVQRVKIYHNEGYVEDCYAVAAILRSNFEATELHSGPAVK